MTREKKSAFQEDDADILAVMVGEDYESFSGEIDDDEADELFREKADDEDEDDDDDDGDEMPEVNPAVNLFRDRKALAAALHPAETEPIEAPEAEEALESKI